MERCVKDDDNIYASEVKMNYEEETIIREAGRLNKLLCYGCGTPVIFRRGEKRGAHFAHKKKTSECDYDEYSKFCKKRSSIWKEYKEILYKHFSNLEHVVNINKDEKVINNHWTPIYVEFKNSESLAIEIVDKTISSKETNDINDLYANLDLNVDWIVVDNISTIKYERNAYYIKRNRLNNSINNSVIVFESNNSLAIYKLDIKEYKTASSSNKQFFSEDTFCYKFELKDLSFIDGLLHVKGFEEEYRAWMQSRDNEFKLEEQRIKNKKRNYKNIQYEYKETDPIHDFKIPDKKIWGKEDFLKCIQHIVKNNDDSIKRTVINKLINSGMWVYNNYLDLLEDMTDLEEKNTWNEIIKGAGFTGID
ncbi:competence protein CoiA family protein [Haloplasma contractile]|uniref:Competence protein n=1 Tax=Haloplasma contractile SSD-17B TaxID=1033810 RepID=F7PUV4_9MOLU|nr:competence protein CoiA family protein [Haloplasma contractile]ERJ11044.1 putative competence protein [Haloplasma contractile SSD-17B]